MKVILLIVLICSTTIAKAQSPDDRSVRLIEIARQLKTTITGEFWPAWEDTPMPTLLVEEDKEFLFHYTPKDTSFSKSSDGLFWRERTQRRDFLAAFHLVDWKPTIVVGTIENTNVRSELHWILSIMHEHFHQLQYGRSDYYSASQSLELAKDKNDFMWPLNYDFPYTSKKVVRRMAAMNKVLLKSQVDGIFDLDKYRSLKSKLRKVISEKDYKYMNFQLWQEGTARMIEIRILEYWISNYREIGLTDFPLEELTSLKDWYYDRIIDDLNNPTFYKNGRVQFYSLGAAELFLIEKSNPEWKHNYFEYLFDVDKL